MTIPSRRTRLNSSTRSRGAEGLRCPALPPRRPDGRALLARCGKHRGVTTRSAPLVERPFAPRVPRFRQGWSFRVWCVKPCRPGLAGGWVDTRTGSVTRRWRLRRSSNHSGKLEPSRSFGIAVEYAGAGVEVPVSVAVATVDPIRGAGAVLGPADRVGLRGEQGFDERAERFAQHIGRRLGRAVPRARGQAGRRAGGQARYLDPTVIVVSFF